jgi:sugar-specific transcriptional regulator TrmB
MKNTNEIISELEVIGFTTQEAKVICVLFEGYIMTPTEVAKESGISRAYAYDVLKSFSQKGICNEIQTSSIVKYELIEPNVVKDKIEKEIFDTYRTRTDKLVSAFQKLIPRYKTKVIKQDESDVELIKGFNKHRFEKFVELMNDTKKELLLINKLGGYIQSDIDENTKQLIKRGCKLKSIYEVSGNFKIKMENRWIDASNEDLIKIFSNFESIGEQVRLSKEVHQNMVIIDRKIVFVSLADPKLPKNSRSDVVIKDQYYANSMAQYFDYFWKQSKTISDFKSEILNKKK